MKRGWRWLVVVAVVVAAPAACDTTTEPEEGTPEQDLQFLRFPEDGPALETRDTSFWAVRGQATTFVLHYEPEPGDTEGDEFLTFQIDQDGLYRRPGGEFFSDGDSIQIHITIDPDGRFLFDFQPSGLVFSPDAPADLEVEYIQLGGDLDDDGDVDDDDAEIETNLQVWKQEAPGEPWYPVGTLILEDNDEIEGEITSFTGFAVAL